MNQIVPFQKIDQSEGECALYRHFDEEGVLLYVGISAAPLLRLQQHRLDSAWFKQIATITIQYFSNRQEAAKAERAAIETESPLFNGRAGRPPLPEGERRVLRSIRLPGALWKRAEAYGEITATVEKALTAWLDEWEGRAHEILTRND